MLLWIWGYKYMSLHFYLWDVEPEVGSLAHNSLVFNLLRKHLMLATLAAAVKAGPVVLGFLAPGLTTFGFSSSFAAKGRTVLCFAFPADR